MEGMMDWWNYYNTNDKYLGVLRPPCQLLPALNGELFLAKLRNKQFWFVYSS